MEDLEEGSSSTPSLVLLLVAQLLTTVGDSFGQRVSRVNHHSSSTRMMMSSALVSALQMLLLVGLLQLVLPNHITADVYDDNNQLTECYREVDVWWTDVKPYETCNGASGADQCTLMEQCPSQGVTSMPRQLFVHPALLYNGFMNVLYLVGETLLYREALGLIFIVVAALFSTFLIAPLSAILGMTEDEHHGGGDRISGMVLCLGIVGSLLCVIEYNPYLGLGAEEEKGLERKGHRGEGVEVGEWLEEERGEGTVAVEEDEALTGEDGAAENEGELERSLTSRGANSIGNVHVGGNGRHRHVSHTSSSGLDECTERGGGHERVSFGKSRQGANSGTTEKTGICYSLVGSSLRILVPFLMLSVCYCLWFVLMRYYNSKCRSNAWGYNAIDQGLLPFYVVPYLFGAVSVANIIARKRVEKSQSGPSGPVLPIYGEGADFSIMTGMEPTSSGRGGTSSNFNAGTYRLLQTSPADDDDLSEVSGEGNTSDIGNGNSSTHLSPSWSQRRSRGQSTNTLRSSGGSFVFDHVQLEQNEAALAKPAAFKLGAHYSTMPIRDFLLLWYSELDFKTVFFYRLCINTRAFMYTYLAIFYDMKVVYLEVQLIRVIMSWMASFFLCWVHPRFIQASEGEVKVVFHPLNLALKGIGTFMSITALYLINK
eukprot:Nk52_evm14s1524 gene=Nk52_evmTU14s1524